MLAQGPKGLAELRDTAENYYNGPRTTSGPTGPLYGMIDFRRRKILIKLVPEGTSRLVQGTCTSIIWISYIPLNKTNKKCLPARVQVHWNSVTARFPSHDSLFESTSTDELNEAGFLAHIELHSGRSSAGSSNKKLHLSGISEEDLEVAPSFAEEKRDNMEGPDPTKSDETRSHDLLAPTDHPRRISSLLTAASATSTALQESLAISSHANAGPDTSISPKQSLKRSITADRGNGDTESMYLVNISSAETNPPALDMDERRLSTASGRPSTSDNYSTSLFDYEMLYKPKVKLGPRPSQDRRPPSSKGSAVATLPAGLRPSRVGLSTVRPSSRDSTATRPKSRDSQRSAYKVPPPPPIPESNSYNLIPRPSSSGNSVKSLPATLPKSPGMSREKQRLMKFREMYREKEKSKEQAPVVLSKAERANAANEEDALAEEADNEAEAEDQNDLDTMDANGQIAMPSIPATSPERSKRNASGSKLKQTTPMTPSEEFPRTSGESLAATSGIENASSPISTADSSGRATSTRPTSVSDSSDFERSEGSSEGATEVTTPLTAEKPSLDEDAHSITTSSTTPTSSSTATAKVEETGKDSSLERVSSTSSVLSASERRQIRRAMVSPITLPADTNNLSDAHQSDSEADVSYDEDLMDELDNAVFVEAKSMIVSKSPITPFFSRRPSTIMSDSTTPMPTPLLAGCSQVPSPTVVNVERTPTGSPARGPGKSPLVGTSESGVSEMDLTPRCAEEATSKITLADDDKTTAVEYAKSEAERDGDEQGKPGLSEPQLSPPLRSASSTTPNSADRTPSFTLLTPTFPSVSPMPRSPAGSFLSSIHQQNEDAIVVSKKGRLGSGVASKIADLQRSFSRGPSAGDAAPMSLPSNRSFSNPRKPLLAQRAGSLADTPRSSTPPRSSSSNFNPSFSVRDAGYVRGRAMSKGSLMSFDSRETKNSTPTRNHSGGSVGPRRLDHRRMSIYDSPQLPTVDFDGRDTVQVKATIVRADGVQGKANPQQLMESPLVVTQRSGTSPSPARTMAPPATSLPSRNDSPTKVSQENKHNRQRSSITAAFRGIKSPSTVTLAETVSSQGVSERETTNKRQSVDLGSSWRTLSRRTSVQLSRSPSAIRTPIIEKPATSFSRSSSARGSDRQSLASPPAANGDHRPSLGRTMSTSSMDSATTADSQQNGLDSKKKGNRASRLMKRVSNGMSSIASVTRAQLGTLNEVENKRASVLEEKEENHRGVGWSAVEVGDLNVQFPDTLVSILGSVSWSTTSC